MESLPNKNQYVYAVLLLMCSFVSVSLITMVGTALPDLQCITNTDLKSASLIFFGSGVGKCIIPFLGLVIDFTSVLPLLTTLALTVIAVFLVFVPISRILNVTAFVYLFVGTAGGATDVARYALPAAIWKTSNVGFYFMSVGTGIATLVTPVFTSLFVNNHRHIGTNSTNFEGADCETNIQVPYTVLALFSILAASGFAINNYSILHQGKQLEEPEHTKDSIRFSNGNLIQKCFYIIILVLFFTITSCLTTIFSFMVTYGLRSYRHIDVKTSSAMTGLFGICLLLARMLCTCIGDRVRPSTLFWSSLVLVNFASLLFLMFKDSSIPMLWFILALHGLGTGPMFVTLVTWAREFIPLSTRLISYIVLMDNFGNVTFSSLTGVLMDVYGVDQFIYAIAGTRILQLVLFSTLQIIVKTIKSR